MQAAEKMVLDMFFRDGVGKDRKNSYVVAEKSESKASQTNDANGAVDSKAEQVEKELAETSSIEPEKPIEDYPYNQREAIEGYADGVDNRILEFLSRVRNLKDHSYRQKTNVEIAQNTERLINDVRELVGTDVTGYKHVLTGGAVEHIDKDHGKNGSSDHSMANDEDIARIGFVIENYDSAELVKKNGKTVYDSEHRSSNNLPAPMIKFSKKINGTFYVVESVPDSKANSFFVKSAYIAKNSSANTDGVLNMTDTRLQPSRSSTSEPPHHSDSTAVNDSIRGNDVGNVGENVNNLQNKAASAAVKTDAVPEVTEKTDVQAEPEVESKAKTASEPKAKTEVKAEIKAEENPEETPKVDTEAKVQAKKEGKEEVPVEPSVRKDMSREANGEAKAKAETTPEMKSSAESETVSEENNGVSEEERSFLETVRHTAQSLKEALKSKKQGGIYSGTDEQTIRATEDLSKSFGVRILLFDGEGKTDIDGFYDRKTNTIYLNAGSHAKPIQATVRHEMIHFLARANAGAFEAFRDFIVGRYAETYGKEALDTWLRNKQAEYEAAGIELDENGAKEELCADLAMDMLNDPETVKGFAKENRSAARRILDALRRFIDKIRVLFGLEPKYTAGKAHALEVLAKTDSTVKITDGKVERSHASFKNDTLPKALNVKDLYTAEKLLYNALVSAEVRNGKAETKSDYGDENADIRYASSSNYDFTKSFAEQVDDFINGNHSRDYFIVSGTPEVFQNVGFNALPVTIDKKHVYYLVNGTKNDDHVFSQLTVKDLPNLIKNPIAIFDSSSRPGRVIALVAEKSKSGKQIIVPIEVDASLNSNSLIMDTNLITSSYGHTSAIKQLLNAVSNETSGKTNLYYWNKKEAVALMHNAGLQLPGNLPKDGFIHSIRESGSKVNTKLENVTHSQQFKRWFGDWENKPYSASKVVDEDGNPLVVYHGTDADFTVFKSKDGNYWFSASEDYAEAMAEERGGNRVMPTYLNMRKPYYAKLKPSQFSDPNFEAAIIREAKSKGYDGVILENDTRNDLEKDTFYVVFAPTQIKSATDNIGTFDGANPDIRYSKSGTAADTKKNVFSYEALTAKPDMRLTDIYTDIPRDENGKVIRKEVADLAIQAVRDSGNKKNTEVDFYVHVDDTNSDLKVSIESIRHGLTRKPDLNAIAALNIVGLAKNAVLINELSPREGTVGGNVYLSAGKDSDNNLYFARLVTDKKNLAISEIETVYAINAKKESVAHYRQGYENKIPFAFTDSTISIADLLDFVKNHFSDILPESVLQHYGISRKESAVSDSVMYSLSGDKKIQPDKKTDYSFRALTAKPDMPITKMQNISESDYAAYLADKSSFVKDMVKRAALFEKNPKNTDTQTYIHNKDTGKDILVSRESFRHGAARMDKEYAQICKNIGSLLQNAVAVNELQSRYDGENSTVFIGMAENKNNYVFVRMIAENRTQRLVSYDILYSIRKKSVKKEDVGKLPPDYTASGGSSYTSSTISIAKLLENVKRENLFSGILSADVKKALGIDSSETSANIDGVMYSLNTDKDSVQTIPKGEAPARDVDVRAFDEHGGKVSEGIRTVAEASVTPDSYVRPLLEDVAKGKYSHEIKTNKGAMARAENVIARDGYQETAERYLKDFEDGRSFGKDDIAVLQTLYAGAAQHMDYLSGTDGDITLAEKLVVAMVQTATNAGQALQAQRLLKKLSPEGTLYAYEKSVNRINRAIERSAGEWDGENNTRVKESGKGFFEKVIDSAQNGYYSPKQAPVEIDTKLKKKLLNAKNPHEMDKVCEEIENDVAKQILSTIPDKLRALRYMSMLTNPRTHVRNIVGNALFGIAIQTRDIVGTIAERAIIRDKSKRTKSIALTPKQRSEYKAIAKQAARFYDEHEAFVKGESNRYDMTTSNIEAAKKPFKNRFLGAILNAIYEFNSNLLEKEDLWFIKGHFVRQFTHALMAKGYTAEQLKNGEVPAEVLQKIAEYASNEAQKATFRDANAAATMLNRIENMSRGTKVAVSAIMPFKKTPMNILRRGIEYSPVSLITAVYKTISQNVQKSKGRIKSVDTAGIINDLSQGLTGSMIFVLGAWLLSQGLLKSGDDEDDKKQSLEEAMGKQSYSIEIGGESFTLDWAAPLCMPLFAGAEFAKALQEKEISPLQVLLRMSDPVLETSMMSGVLDFLSSGKYADGDSGIIQRMVQSAVSSYVLQFFPTAMGAVARVMDEYESRTTRTDKKGDAAFWERLGRQIVNKIPYARQVFNKPYVDVFGKQEKKEKPLDYALSLIKNTIVPGYITSVSGTKSEKVLYEVMEESKETKFIPGFVTKFAVDKVQHTLTQEEYYNYHVMRGEWYEAYLPEVASDKWFTDLEADQKAIVLESFKEIADDLTKKRVIPEYTIRSNRSKYIYNMLYGDKPVSGQEAVNVVKQVFHEIILSELAKKQAEEEREKLLDAESTEAIGK